MDSVGYCSKKRVVVVESVPESAVSKWWMVKRKGEGECRSDEFDWTDWTGKLLITTSHSFFRTHFSSSRPLFIITRLTRSIPLWSSWKTLRSRQAGLLSLGKLPAGVLVCRFLGPRGYRPELSAPETRLFQHLGRASSRSTPLGRLGSQQTPGGLQRTRWSLRGQPQEGQPGLINPPPP